jgi:hypothetical protein
MSGIVRVVRPKPSGVVTITENNVQIDVSKFAVADVAVPVAEGIVEATTDAEMMTFVDESEGGEIVKFTGTSSTYEKGRLYIVKGAKKEISFTVKNTSYKALEGMTWGEWVESDYNTVSAELYGTQINFSGFVVSGVTSSDVIENGAAYSLISGGGND